MTAILIIIACIALLWWCVKPKLNINGETSPEIPRLLPTPVIVPPRPGGPPRDIPKCKPRNMQQGSVDLHFDGLRAAFSGKTVEQCREERERNSEILELQHLGMLREVQND